MLKVIGALPGVVAVPSMPLSSVLFQGARRGVRAVRAYRRSSAGALAISIDDEARVGMAVGRAVLDSMLQEMRATVRCRHLVLHDSLGFSFPLADASGIKIIELVADRVPEESAAKTAIRATLNGLRGPERFPNAAGYLRVDEDRLAAPAAGLSDDIGAFLDAGESTD